MTTLCYSGVSAQLFNSLEIKEIYNLCEHSKYQSECEIRKDDFGRIIHIGLPIFGTDARKHFLPPISDFLERYNLYFRLLNTTERNEIVRDKKLEVDVEKFLQVDSTYDFSIGYDGNQYVATWKKDGISICSFLFENNFSLIFGMNIAESQQFFFEEISKYADSSLFAIKKNDLVISDNKKFLVQKGCTYMIEGMKSDLYFWRKDTTAVHSALSPAESLSNVFAGITENQYVLDITQNLYGYETRNFNVPLKRFVNYCLSNNCKPFVGIEKIEEKFLKATVIYVNSDFGYNHLLSIEFPVSALETQSGIIKAKLNTFIPTHNIKNMYNEHKNR